MKHSGSSGKGDMGHGNTGKIGAFGHASKYGDATGKKATTSGGKSHKSVTKLKTHH